MSNLAYIISKSFKKNVAFIFIIQIILIGASHAKIKLGLNENNQKVQIFIKNIEALLPEKIRSVILGVDINVFFDINSKITKKVCHSPHSLAIQNFENKQEPLNERNNNILHHGIYGYTDNCSQNNHICNIHLNSEFLDIINNSDNHTKYDCGHSSDYKIVEATLIHELSHIFDRIGNFEILTPDDKKVTDLCFGNIEAFTGNPQKPLLCKLLDHQFAISDRADFLNLIGWSKNLFSKNIFQSKDILRSPDQYEYASPNENFAVNMEFFLLDPSYKCRRPLYYEYLSSKFNVFPKSDCNFNSEIFLSETYEKVKLDPELLLQVDYVFVEDGSAAESKFGHSAFLLTFKHNNFNSEAREKFVISYVAGSDNPKVWDGLTGKYQTQLIIQRLADFITPNRWLENRTVYMYPLKMSKTERKRFLLKSIENYWSYSSPYYFITNNCSTQSLMHLQSTYLESEWQIREFKVTTPSRLLKLLKDSGKLNINTFQAINSEKYFLEKIWSTLQTLDTKTKSLIKYSTYNDYMRDNLNDHKFSLIMNMTNRLPINEKNKILKLFIQLESQKIMKKLYLINLEIIQDFKVKVAEDIKLLEPTFYTQGIEKLNKLANLLVPSNFTTVGYGIPLQHETISESKIKHYFQKHKDLWIELYNKFVKSNEKYLNLETLLDNDIHFIHLLKKQLDFQSNYETNIL